MKRLEMALLKEKKTTEDQEYIDLFEPYAVREDIKLAKEVTESEDIDMTNHALVFRNVYAMKAIGEDVYEEVFPLELELLYKKRTIGEYTYYSPVQETKTWRMKF